MKLKLIEEFEKKKRIYLRKKHQCSKKSEREREQKIKKFLTFCERQGVKKIRDIEQKHYDTFMQQLSVSTSTETRRNTCMRLESL